MVSTGLRITEVTTLEGIGPHLRAWQSLADSATHGEWFAGPVWLLPWLEAFWPPDRLALQFAYRGDELVGVVPLVQMPADRRGCAPQYGLPVNSHVRRIGMLSSIAPADLLRLTLGSLKSRGIEGCLGFRQLPEHGEWNDAVQAAAESLGLLSFHVDEGLSAIVDFGAGWEPYVSGLDHQLVKRLNYQRRRLDRTAGWRMTTVTSPSDVCARWDDVLRIETASWKHAQQTSIANEPGASVLYEGVARRCADAGILRLHILEFEGVPVAHVFGVLDRGVFYLLKTSYSEAHRASSPGITLVWHALQDAVAIGCHRFDFMGGAEDWKKGLATSSPTYVNRTVFPASSLRCHSCRLKESTLKPLARRLGVKRLADTVRSSIS
jgi:hypothetical protein